jgi:hypothetical protein
MKVFIIAPFESVLEGRGTRYPELAKMLKKNSIDTDIEYVTTNFSHQNKKKYTLIDIKNKQEEVSRFYNLTLINIYGYSSNISLSRVYSHISLSFKYYKYLKSKVNKGDIIIVSSIPPELLYAISLLKYKKIKIILDVRDIWPDSLNIGNKIAKSLFSAYCNFYYKRSVNKVDKIVTVAKGFQNWLLRYGVLNYKFIPLGYDDYRWNKSNFFEFNNSIAYVGYLNSQFDITLFIEYTNKTDLTFNIVGGGEKTEYYKTLSTTKSNIFHGFKTLSETTDIISNSSIGILPLSKGSNAFLPNKFFDYIGAGIPIICFKDSDSADLILKYKIGWVIERNISSLSDVFDDVDFKSVYSNYRKNVLLMRETFSKKNLYEEFILLIKSLRSDI